MSLIEFEAEDKTGKGTLMLKNIDVQDLKTHREVRLVVGHRRQSNEYQRLDLAAASMFYNSYGHYLTASALSRTLSQAPYIDGYVFMT
ncbi:hypothetical protein GE21DRAFT_1336571 [Neurospora crassa]|nr:hypothetical protein GE21DRAFT_1336571 [Neurospora crassa]